ncbi:MAG: glycerophosphodiester phosphodiesterase family protein [Paracoccaceae bacterium]
MRDIRDALKGNGRPLIVAHRGDHTDAPENSCAAIRAAQAYDMVEIDVQLSSDGVPVVIHDPTVVRTTGQAGAVKHMTADVLQDLRLEGSAETLPTLDDALVAGGDALLFDVDVKDPSELPAVAAILSKNPNRRRCMLKSDVACQTGLDELLDLQSKYGVTVIAKSALKEPEGLRLVQAMYEADVAAIELWFEDLDLLRRATSVGVPITTYTLPDVHCAGLDDGRALENPAAVWGSLADVGVRAIMTDEPRAARHFFEHVPSVSSR